MPFLSFESNSLSVTAIQKCCVKESLSQGQDCGYSIFSQIKSHQQISIYFYWFYGQKCILQSL